MNNTTPHTAPLATSHTEIISDVVLQLNLARAEIARLAKMLAQAQTDLAVAREIIEKQRAALAQIRAALPLEE